MNALDLQLKRAEDIEDDTLCGRLGREMREQATRLKLAENAEQAHRIQMRSATNKRVILEKLKDDVSNQGEVPVVSISNSLYARHVAGYRYPERNTTVLTVEQTNIPTLRRIVSAFPNESRLNELKTRGNVSPTLLGIFSTDSTTAST